MSAEILLKKEYPPSGFLSMGYYRKKRGPRKVLYNRDFYKLSSDEESEFEDVLGIYCLSCGSLKEYTENSAIYPVCRPIKCSCGQETEYLKLMNCNHTSNYLKSDGRAWSSQPVRVSISRDDKHINISMVMRTWGFNAKAAKPYYNDFQITMVINTSNGQTYLMPSKWKNEVVFGADSVRTASFTFNSIRNRFSDILSVDPEVMGALESCFREARPEIKGSFESLNDIVRANFLGDLYPLFSATSKLDADDLKLWARLHRRYEKNPETFHKYLIHGCKEVSTKSIRKVLYKYPDQKWTLHFLYKVLGIKNIDILRDCLWDRDGAVTRICRYTLFYSINRETFVRQVRYLSNALSEAGLTDRRKIELLCSSNRGFHQFRDTARMYEQYENIFPRNALAGCKTLDDLHDALSDIDQMQRNKHIWERYREKISYTDEILALEESFDNADFKIIKKPWDLRALGARFHNCVGSYMEDVKQRHSIIVEMLLNGKSAACIELDGEGKTCHQAFGSCNNRLEGDAAERFNEWIQRHGIKPGRMIPHYNNIPMQPDEAIPF